MTASSQLSAVRTSLSRSVIVAATAFVLAGALRLTAAAEQLGVSVGFGVLFFVAAVAQIAFGVLLSIGGRRTTATPVAVAAMMITLVFIGLWLVATLSMVPLYPIMNGPYPIDVLDLGSAILEATSVVALCRSLPQPARRRVAWSLVGLVSVAWLVWSVIVVGSGLSN
ncbi:hypothetical protein [Amycolatopsis taiwanensis]|uniref:hypothetical protein n=1 Tax=Amycolatopsis taiwanensis TaxID=342230 RepID=UPI000486F3DB|nr:hypothetical protein [Amycolatopsis taiwanensis]